jgi:hypothetical protein
VVVIVAGTVDKDQRRDAETTAPAVDVGEEEEDCVKVADTRCFVRDLLPLPEYQSWRNRNHKTKTPGLLSALVIENRIRSALQQAWTAFECRVSSAFCFLTSMYIAACFVCVSSPSPPRMQSYR